MFENRTYAVVDTIAFQNALSSGSIELNLLFDNILETNMSTLRYSVCGDQFIIKANNQASVDYLSAKAIEFNIPFQIYDHEGMLQVVSTSAWNIPLNI